MSSITAWRMSATVSATLLVRHQFDALVEDHLALIVHHVVELQDVLADVEVARLDLLLRLFQRLVDPGMDDRLALLQAELGAACRRAVGPEDAHQVVFQRQEEFRAAGIALTAGAAAQLVVDAAAFVALGAEHEQPAGGLSAFSFRPSRPGSRISPTRGLVALGSPSGMSVQVSCGCACRRCRRAGCRCRGRPCWWRS